MPQSLAKIYLHIIFSTKNRVPFLSDKRIRNETHSYMATILKKLDSHPVIIGGIADHVHILCTLPKSNTFVKIIGETKRVSSIWIKTKDKRFSKFGWQKGYGAFSVSYSVLQNVRSYICNQEKLHEKISFQDEFLEFLNKHKTNFDERYVWD